MSLAALAGAALLIWSAVIHLHLWATGYRHIPTIGPLFLVQGIAGIVVAVAIVALRRPIVLVGGALFAAGTVGGLLLSVNVGLFGFQDSLSAPFAVQSLVVESIAFAVLGGTTVLALAAAGRHPPAPAPIGHDVSRQRDVGRQRRGIAFRRALAGPRRRCPRSGTRPFPGLDDDGGQTMAAPDGAPAPNVTDIPGQEPDDGLFGVLAETSDDAVFLCDATARIATWSTAAVRLFGHPAPNALGRPFHFLFPDHLRSQVRVVLAAVAAGDRIQHFESEVAPARRHADAVSLSLCPFVDPARGPSSS